MILFLFYQQLESHVALFKYQNPPYTFEDVQSKTTLLDNVDIKSNYKNVNNTKYCALKFFNNKWCTIPHLNEFITTVNKKKRSDNFYVFVCACKGTKMIYTTFPIYACC